MNLGNTTRSSVLQNLRQSPTSKASEHPDVHGLLRPPLRKGERVAPRPPAAAFAYPTQGLGEDPNGAGIAALERDRLLLEQLPAIRYLARRIHSGLPRHVELEDLISAGAVGLIDAFSKFDHTKKTQFKTYAQFRIRGAIMDSLRMLDWGPRRLRRKGREVAEAIRVSTQRLGRVPAEHEIALEMALTLSQFQQLQGELKNLEIGDLQGRQGKDSGDQELANLLGSPEEDPLFRCMKGELKQWTEDAIDELPERERLVTSLYYYEEMTMREIALTMGVVESRVSQIHSAALLHLRVALATLHSPNPVTAVKPTFMTREKPWITMEPIKSH